MRVTKAVKEEQMKILEDVYFGAKPQLVFSTNFELLVAVILSAQCTDVRVNIVTERLFKKANTPQKILEFGIKNLENEIHDCGFFRAKAKHIFETSNIILEKFNGEVPNNFDDLVSLPGVGRKTANVIMAVAFKKPAIAVDTHVFRVSNRLGLAKGNTPLEVEEGLKKVIPKEKWGDFHHYLIWHGRKICKAKKPLCDECPLNKLCETKG